MDRERERKKFFLDIPLKNKERLAVFDNRTAVNDKSFPCVFVSAQKWIPGTPLKCCFQRDDYILKMMDVCWVMWATGGCPGCLMADDLPPAAIAQPHFTRSKS